MLSIKIPNESLAQLPSISSQSRKKDQVIHLQWIPDTAPENPENNRSFKRDKLPSHLQLLALTDKNVYVYSTFKYSKPNSLIDEVKDKAATFLFGDYHKPWSLEKIFVSREKTLAFGISSNSRWLTRLFKKQKASDKENKADSFYLQRIDLLSPESNIFSKKRNDDDLISVPWLFGSNIFVGKNTDLYQRQNPSVFLNISDDGKSILFSEPRGGHFHIWNANDIVSPYPNMTGDWYSLPMTGAFPCHTNDSRTTMSCGYQKDVSSSDHCWTVSVAYPSPISPSQVILTNFTFSYCMIVKGDNRNRIMKSSIEHVTLTWNTALLQKGDWLDLETLEKTSWSVSLEKNGIKNSNFKVKTNNNDLRKNTGILSTESDHVKFVVKQDKSKKCLALGITGQTTSRNSLYLIPIGVESTAQAKMVPIGAMILKQLGLGEDLTLADESLEISDIAWIMNDTFLIVCIKKGFLALTSRDGLVVKWWLAENHKPMNFWHIESLVFQEKSKNLFGKESLSRPSTTLILSPSVDENHALAALSNGWRTIVFSLPSFDDQIVRQIHNYYNELTDEKGIENVVSNGSWSTAWIEPVWQVIPTIQSHFETRRLLFLSLWRLHLIDKDSLMSNDDKLLSLVQFYCKSIFSKGLGKTSLTEDHVFSNHISMAKHILWCFSTTTFVKNVNYSTKTVTRDSFTEHIKFLKLLSHELVLYLDSNPVRALFNPSYLLRTRLLIANQVVLYSLWKTVSPDTEVEANYVKMTSIFMSLSRRQLEKITTDIKGSTTNFLAQNRKDLETRIWSNIFSKSSNSLISKTEIETQVDQVYYDAQEAYLIGEEEKAQKLFENMGPIGYPCLFLLHLSRNSFMKALQITVSTLYTYEETAFNLLRLSHHDVYEVSREPRDLTHPTLLLMVSLWVQWIASLENRKNGSFHVFKFPSPSYLDEKTILKHLQFPNTIIPKSDLGVEGNIVDFEYTKTIVGIELGFMFQLTEPLLSLLAKTKSYDNMLLYFLRIGTKKAYDDYWEACGKTLASCKDFWKVGFALSSLHPFFPQGTIPLLRKFSFKILEEFRVTKRKIVSECIMYPENDTCQPSNFADGTSMYLVNSFGAVFGKKALDFLWTGLDVIATQQISGQVLQSSWPNFEGPTSFRDEIVDAASSILELCWEMHVWKLYAYLRRMSLDKTKSSTASKSRVLSTKLLDCIVFLLTQETTLDLGQCETECFHFQVLECLVKLIPIFRTNHMGKVIDTAMAIKSLLKEKHGRNLSSSSNFILEKLETEGILGNQVSYHPIMIAEMLVTDKAHFIKTFVQDWRTTHQKEFEAWDHSVETILKNESPLARVYRALTVAKGETLLVSWKCFAYNVDLPYSQETYHAREEANDLVVKTTVKLQSTSPVPVFHDESCPKRPESRCLSTLPPTEIDDQEILRQRTPLSDADTIKDDEHKINVLTNILQRDPSKNPSISHIQDHVSYSLDNVKLEESKFNYHEENVKLVDLLEVQRNALLRSIGMKALYVKESQSRVVEPELEPLQHGFQSNQVKFQQKECFEDGNLQSSMTVATSSFRKFDGLLRISDVKAKSDIVAHPLTERVLNVGEFDSLPGAKVSGPKILHVDEEVSKIQLLPIRKDHARPNHSFLEIPKGKENQEKPRTELLPLNAVEHSDRLLHLHDKSLKLLSLGPKKSESNGIQRAAQTITKLGNELGIIDDDDLVEPPSDTFAKMIFRKVEKMKKANNKTTVADATDADDERSDGQQRKETLLENAHSYLSIEDVALDDQND